MTNQNQPTVSESIISKVRKLMKSQESFLKIGSMEEANTFAAKIQEILSEYNLSQADITDKKEVEIVRENMAHTIPSVGGFVNVEVMYAIAKHNFCFVYRDTNPNSNSRLIIIGKPENIEVCKYIFNNVMSAFKVIGKREFENAKKAGYKKGLDTFLRTFYVGCRMGLDKKLSREKENLMKKHEGMSGLIKNNDQSLQNFVQQNMGKVSKTKRMIKDGQVLRSGINTGLNAQINKGLSGTPVKKQRLIN